MPTRLLAATLCLTLTLGFAPPAAALRPSAEGSGLEELRAGLEERPMTPPPVSPPQVASAGQPERLKTGGGVTAAEVVEYLLRVAPYGDYQINESLLTVRTAQPGQRSLHLGTGASLFPVVEALAGLRVDAIDHNPSMFGSLQRYLERNGIAQEILRRGGRLRFRSADARQLPDDLPLYDHVIALDLFPPVAPGTRWGPAFEAIARQIVTHLVPEGTGLVTIGVEEVEKTLDTCGVRFTVRDVTNTISPGATADSVWLFTLAPLQEQIRAMLDRVVAEPGEASQVARRAPVYQIMSQEVAKQYRGLAVLAELGHHVLIDRGAETVAQIPRDVETADYYGSDADSRRFGLAVAQAKGHSLTFVRRDPDAETLALLLRQLLATLGDLAPDVVARRVDVDLLARWLEQAA